MDIFEFFRLLHESYRNHSNTLLFKLKKLFFKKIKQLDKRLSEKLQPINPFCTQFEPEELALLNKVGVDASLISRLMAFLNVKEVAVVEREDGYEITYGAFVFNARDFSMFKSLHRKLDCYCVYQDKSILHEISRLFHLKGAFSTFEYAYLTKPWANLALLNTIENTLSLENNGLQVYRQLTEKYLGMNQALLQHTSTHGDYLQEKGFFNLDALVTIALDTEIHKNEIYAAVYTRLNDGKDFLVKEIGDFDAFFELLEETVGRRVRLTGYNICDFDIPQIKKRYPDKQSVFREDLQLIDIMWIFAAAFPVNTGVALDDAVDWFNIPKDKSRHEAKNDVLYANAVWERLDEELQLEYMGQRETLAALEAKLPLIQAYPELEISRQETVLTGNAFLVEEARLDSLISKLNATDGQTAVFYQSPLLIRMLLVKHFREIRGKFAVVDEDRGEADHFQEKVVSDQQGYGCLFCRVASQEGVLHPDLLSLPLKVASEGENLLFVKHVVADNQQRKLPEGQRENRKFLFMKYSDLNAIESLTSSCEHVVFTQAALLDYYMVSHCYNLEYHLELSENNALKETFDRVFSTGRMQSLSQVKALSGMSDGEMASILMTTDSDDKLSMNAFAKGKEASCFIVKRDEDYYLRVLDLFQFQSLFRDLTEDKQLFFHVERVPGNLSGFLDFYFNTPTLLKAQQQKKTTLFVDESNQLAFSKFTLFSYYKRVVEILASHDANKGRSVILTASPEETELLYKVFKAIGFADQVYKYESHNPKRFIKQVRYEEQYLFIGEYYHAGILQNESNIDHIFFVNCTGRYANTPINRARVKYISKLAVSGKWKSSELKGYDVKTLVEYFDFHQAFFSLSNMLSAFNRKGSQTKLILIPESGGEKRRQQMFWSSLKESGAFEMEPIQPGSQQDYRFDYDALKAELEYSRLTFDANEYRALLEEITGKLEFRIFVSQEDQRYRSLMENKEIAEHFLDNGYKTEKEQVGIAQNDIINFALRSFTGGAKSRDAFVIAATGKGKSLIYQIPSFLLARDYDPKLTIIISPLIALMKDQVDALHDKGFENVMYINSSQDYDQKQLVYSFVQMGLVSVLFVSPELFSSRGFINRVLKKRECDLLVVDESHCVSNWGHDFRIDYSMIKNTLQKVFNRRAFPMLCLTATAKFSDDPRESVVGDVIRTLGLDISDKEVIASSTERKNLAYLKMWVSSSNKKKKQSDETENEALDEDKFQVIKDLITHESEVINHVFDSTRSKEGNILIYLEHKIKANLLAKRLTEETGMHFEAFHSDVLNERKIQIQEDYKNGRIKGVVGTTAFGMGVDIGNIRMVIHYALPKGVENYYQEAGRAGRDGEPSVCILLHNQDDIEQGKYLLTKGRLIAGDFYWAYRYFNWKRTLSGRDEIVLSDFEMKNILDREDVEVGRDKIENLLYYMSDNNKHLADKYLLKYSKSYAALSLQVMDTDVDTLQSPYFSSQKLQDIYKALKQAYLNSSEKADYRNISFSDIRHIYEKTNQSNEKYLQQSDLFLAFGFFQRRGVIRMAYSNLYTCRLSEQGKYHDWVQSFFKEIPNPVLSQGKKKKKYGDNYFYSTSFGGILFTVLNNHTTINERNNQFQLFDKAVKSFLLRHLKGLFKKPLPKMIQNSSLIFYNVRSKGGIETLIRRTLQKLEDAVFLFMATDFEEASDRFVLWDKFQENCLEKDMDWMTWKDFENILLMMVLMGYVSSDEKEDGALAYTVELSGERFSVEKIDKIVLSLRENYKKKDLSYDLLSREYIQNRHNGIVDVEALLKKPQTKIKEEVEENQLFFERYFIGELCGVQKMQVGSNNGTDRVIRAIQERHNQAPVSHYHQLLELMQNEDCKHALENFLIDNQKAASVICRSKKEKDEIKGKIYSDMSSLLEARTKGSYVDLTLKTTASYTGYEQIDGTKSIEYNDGLPGTSRMRELFVQIQSLQNGDFKVYQEHMQEYNAIKRQYKIDSFNMRELLVWQFSKMVQRNHLEELFKPILFNRYGLIIGVGLSAEDYELIKQLNPDSMIWRV